MKKINKIGNDLYRLVKFPYMENNFDSLNEYQVLSKLYGKINECVDKCNYIIDNTDADAVKKQLDEIKLDIATYKEQINENIANFENTTNSKIDDFNSHIYFKNNENYNGIKKLSISNFNDGVVSANSFNGEYIYNYTADSKKLILTFEIACTNLRVTTGKSTVFLLQTPGIKQINNSTSLFATWRERYAGEYIAFSRCVPKDGALEINIPQQVIDGNFDICSIQLLNGVVEEMKD